MGQAPRRSGNTCRDIFGRFWVPPHSRIFVLMERWRVGWLLFRLAIEEHGNIHKNSENNTILEANRSRSHREIRRRDRGGL